VKGKRVLAVACGLLGGLLIALAAGAVEGTAATYSRLAVQWHAADLRVGMDVWGVLLLALYAIGAPLAGLLADLLKGHAVSAGAVLLAAAATVLLGLTHWVLLINLSAYASGWLQAVTSAQIGAALGLLPAGLLLAAGLVLPWLQPERDAALNRPPGAG
jgi:hypothetical protein